MANILMAAYTHYERDPRVRRQAEALVKAGHHVDFLACRRQSECTLIELEGVHVRRIHLQTVKPDSVKAYLTEYGAFFARLLAYMTIRPRRYQLIHINNMPDFLVFAAVLPRMLGIPVIHDVHDLMPELFMEKFNAAPTHWVIRALAMQERWAGKLATAVLTVEERLRNRLSARGIPKEKINVLLNLPDERIFAPLPPAPDKPDKFVLVYHGTLARRLGLDIALRAVEKLSVKIPNLMVRIIGAGEQRESLIKLCRQLNLDNTVWFSDDYVPVEAIPGLLEGASAAFIPLRKSASTDMMLPTKLLEYVLLGIPVITPRTGTIQRYFNEDMVRYFEAEDVDSLAEAVLDLYLHAEKRQLLRQNAAEGFLLRYRWDTHKAVYLDLVEQLMAQAR